MQFVFGSSAVGVPVLEGGLWVYRVAVDVDLEVEVAADRDRVAGLADGADLLARVDVIASPDQGRAGHVSVEVAALLAFAVDQQVVAVEDRVIARLQHRAVADRDQRGPASGDDVEALVSAAAAARGAEFADRTAAAMRALDGEDVGVVLDGTIATGDASRGGSGDRREEEREKG